MACKCVVVEVHVGPVGLYAAPEKVAQQVRWVLEGATVPGLKILEVVASNCTRFDHEFPRGDWWEDLLKGLAQSK